MWVSVDMAFKLTYTDGQESDYDDGTKWKVEDGVLKLGREEGNWSVFVSPGHWATIEIGKGSKEKKQDKDEKDKGDKDDKDEKDDTDDTDDTDDKDDKDDKDDD
ncbi:MAG: hypothetical protein QOD36_1287 [Mycobacterium sp.]|jgi:hypothetical protein|nr:hypothetical protein [Mycobacterium sp.]